MSSNRIYFGLTTLLIVTLGCLSAFGQDHELEGMAPFEPADVQPYDNWAKPKDGFFLTFDGIFWSISAPKITSIGDPNLASPLVFDSSGNSFPESNSMDTGAYRAKWKLGDRTEFGYMEEHDGFLVSIINTPWQTQSISGQGVNVLFNEPALGLTAGGAPLGFLDFINSAGITARAPWTVGELTAMNRTQLEGVEASYVYRLHQLHDGGSVEFLFGARYVELDDQFLVSTTGGDIWANGSTWDTYAKNKIAGPQLGVRWSKQIGMFSISSEGRAMAGINTETLTQNSLQAPLLSGPLPNPTSPPSAAAPAEAINTGGNHTLSFTEFTPLVEFRVEGHYELTESIVLKAGWSAIWMNGIARASDCVDYTLPYMGITNGNDGNRQDVFVSGFNLGFELNR
jgi:hypothetical protein